MTTLEFKTEVDNFFSDKLNINHKKFQKENPHLYPEFYFLFLAINIDKLKTQLDTPKNSTSSRRTSSKRISSRRTSSRRTSSRKRTKKEYY